MGTAKDFEIIENGDRVTGTFSEAEMARRLSALRTVMAELDLAAVVLTSIHGILYFSDFLYCSFGRPFGLVVTADRSTVLAPLVDFGHPWRRTGAVLSYTDWRQDTFYDGARSLVGTAGRVGVEFDHLSVAGHRKLADALAPAELVDVAGPLMQLRMIKSAEEIGLIVEAARIADLGGEACRAALADGVAEHEVALAGTDAMVREIARSRPDSEIRDTWSWCQSGINSDGAHNPVTTRQVGVGDIVLLNCFPMIAGYYAALERTLFLGHADEASLRYWSINLEVHHLGLSLIRPGVRCRDIAGELNRLCDHHGVLDRRTFGYGHSFGVICHYYGRESGLELREDIDTVLEEGMVVSMEPMITIPQGEPGAGGYREHDILVVTADGSRNITGFPLGPDHNIVGP